jgi:nitrogenase-associated protein
MATVVFYEKPGCSGNQRQKALLLAAGHHIIAKNLLAEAWRAQELRAFFGQLPVSDWFNPNAPDLKSGLIQPDQLDEHSALALMLANPLLIRRPLLQVGEQRHVGFDQEQIDQWIGLSIKNDQNLEQCSKTLAQTSCRHD